MSLQLTQYTGAKEMQNYSFQDKLYTTRRYLQILCDCSSSHPMVCGRIIMSPILQQRSLHSLIRKTTTRLEHPTGPKKSQIASKVISTAKHKAYRVVMASEPWSAALLYVAFIRRHTYIVQVVRHIMYWFGTRNKEVEIIACSVIYQPPLEQSDWSECYTAYLHGILQFVRLIATCV